MMRHAVHSALPLICAATGAFLAAIAPAHAGSEAIDAAEVTAVCMIYRDAESGSHISAILPESDVAALQAKGYTTAQCDTAFPTRGSMIAWRDRVCEMAASEDVRMQELVEERFGIAPAAFCGMAELVIGQWRGKTSGEYLQ